MPDLTLASWREQTAALHLADTDLAAFRSGRDAMFRSHPQSPVEPGAFAGLTYFDGPSPFSCESDLHPATGSIEVDTGGPDGVLHYDRVGRLTTPWGDLTLFWLVAYGGGLFLPFRDPSPLTYGGGRYLTDTAKGTFGRGLSLLAGDRVRLDFDYAYNPSCAYDDRWACPLAPQENWLDSPVTAGEQVYVPGASGSGGTTNTGPVCRDSRSSR